MNFSSQPPAAGSANDEALDIRKSENSEFKSEDQSVCFAKSQTMYYKFYEILNDLIEI